MEINHNIIPYDTVIEVICVSDNEILNETMSINYLKRYKASLINSFHLPLHWEVTNDEGMDTICALEYLVPIDQWRNKQINKIINKQI